uniref:Uncharacterized protein n=1 Tax=Megaviridae environmental sample TaxID=1737588 RepID=A0A5J6VKX1_9VIRU|nr:MAG: hypothetical protein [Megaviridae environmental sample]
MKNYDNLISVIEDELKLNLSKFKDLSRKEKDEKTNNFYLILQNEDLYNLFSNRKIKLFSSKTVETHNISKSLFDEDVLLKSVFNNQPIKIKNKLWSCLFKIYIGIEKNQSVPNTEKLNSVERILVSLNNNLTDNVKENLLNVDVNESTDNMLDDIVGSFQSLLSDNKNPFDNIMNITNNITTKYKDNLNNGEIELDKVISSIQTSLPKIIAEESTKETQKEKVVIDNNFSTADVDIGTEKPESSVNLSNMMNSMKSMPDVTGLMSMVSNIDKVDTEEGIEKLKNEMNSYLKNDLNVDMDSFDQKFKDLENNFNSNPNDIIEE